MTNTTSTGRRGRGPRGEYAKTQARRIEILDAALEVFAQSGYRSGSLRDVAERVGMSEAGLLHHFSSKRALLVAVLDHRDERSRELIPENSPDGVDTVLGMVALARHNSRTPGVVELYCVLSAEATSPDHPAHEYFIRRYEVTRGMLTVAFEKLRRDGRWRVEVEPSHAAIQTIAYWDGLQIQWLLDRDILDMGDLLEEFVRSLADLSDRTESTRSAE